MRNALLIHGWNTKDEFMDMRYETPSNQHWFPWLSKQLMIRGIHTVSLEMPNSYYPEYDVWVKELERFDITNETILVGHSCGAGFIVRYLSEHPELKVSQVVLVAPWLGYGTDGRPFDETFFQFDINPNLAQQADDVVLLASTNDMSDVQRSVDEIRGKVREIRYIELENKGHFCKKDLGMDAFPELLEVIIERTTPVGEGQSIR